MIVSVWILGDQLVEKHPALMYAIEAYGRDQVRVVMVRSRQHGVIRPYQRKRLVLVYSAMRHYAATLETQGIVVDFVESDSFVGGLQDHLSHCRPEKMVAMEASSYPGRLFQTKKLPELLGDSIALELVPNTQFLVGQYNPIPDPKPDKRYVMENFYRDMRRHFDVLLTAEGTPVGGGWNFDKENRQKLPKNNTPPADIFFEPDEVTRRIMAEVEAIEPAVGTAAGFGYAVTREQALQAFDHFITTRFEQFGPYEDALTKRSHSLYHSVLSPYLNIGLLEPMELVRAAEQAYRDGRAPINSVEGFIRQIIGWREFMYWQYWRQMPGMLEKNAWQATRPLPEFFWTGETDMACMNHALTRAIDTGYNHHIERLMVLSNYCMLAGIDPAVVNDWFTSMYIDAYDWVMPPNVIGMSLNADDGLTATKPYIASANYINKMGDLCKGCRFNPKQRHGEDGCPFNFLYWNFILQHEERLRKNPRLGKNVLGLRYLDEAERSAVRRQAGAYLNQL